MAAVALAVALAAGATTKTGHVIALAVQHFLLYYAGVFALVALTASVGAGLAAADRVVMSPGGRIAAQAAHRAMSFAAVAFLAVHLVVEVLAGRSRPSDAVVPFLHPGRTFYLGIGTIASDLLIVIVVTGLLRGRFARLRPAWLWRAVHAVAYLCWPFAIVHGLLAGRTAKPYVDWSYGACVAAVALALVFRVAAGPRLGESAASHAEEPPVGIPSPALPSTEQLAGAGLAGAPPSLLGPESPWVPGTPPFVPGTRPPFMPAGTHRPEQRALPGPSSASTLTRSHPSYPGAGGASGLTRGHPSYPGAGGASGLTRGHPSYPGVGGASGLTGGHPSYPGAGDVSGLTGGHPSYPGAGGASGLTRGHPSYPGAGGAEPGYPGAGYYGAGSPGEGYPGPGYPERGWAGHEPAQAPCPGDGGR